jgi:hypothetical protein
MRDLPAGKGCFWSRLHVAVLFSIAVASGVGNSGEQQVQPLSEARVYQLMACNGGYACSVAEECGAARSV